MRQLILNIPDSDMRTLERVAKAKDIRPEQLITEQVIRIVRTDRTLLGSTTKVHAMGVGKRNGLLQHPRPTDDNPPVETHQATADMPENAEAERERRRAVLSRTAGLWKNHAGARADGVREDGVEYQVAARSEWD